MLNTIGHTLSVLGGYIYPDSESPEYIRGFGICMSFAFAGCIAAATHSLILWRINKRRDREEDLADAGTPDTFTHADKAVSELLK